jgi:hypothetical protein
MWEFIQTPQGRNVLEKAIQMQNPRKPQRLVSRPQIQADFKGKKVRAVRNKVHFRPLDESFQDFQLNLLLWTLGKKWYDEQSAK